jgi:hypothetical protein
MGMFATVTCVNVYAGPKFKSNDVQESCIDTGIDYSP